MGSTLKQVRLGQKQLSNPINIGWERVNIGDEFNGVIKDVYNDAYLVRTDEGLFGLLNKSLIEETSEKLRLKVNSKFDYCELLSFVPASFEILNIEGEDEEEEIKTESSFIEEELTSYNSFKKSILGTHGSDQDHEIIRSGFDLDPNIFSKEVSSKFTLYIQFELNSIPYENTFKQQAIPYFLNNEIYTKDSYKRTIELLSNSKYWFRLNRRPGKEINNEEIIEFSLYNEDINFLIDVSRSKDGKEYRFIIKHFSFGHSFPYISEAKKRNSRYGSFLLSSKLKILTPFENFPLGNSLKEFLDYVTLKQECFSRINKLKLDAGEILRLEGKTLTIIDRFLEYQLELLDEQKETNVFVQDYMRIPSESGGVAIKVPHSVGDSLELEEDEVVNIRLKQDSLRNDGESELVKLMLC